MTDGGEALGSIVSARELAKVSGTGGKGLAATARALHTEEAKARTHPQRP